MKLLTVHETAQYLRLHPMTVYKMLQVGQIVGVKIGALWRVPVDKLDILLDNISNVEN